MKKAIFVFLLILLMLRGAVLAGDTFIYADGYSRTSDGQPPRHWIIGETKSPAPGESRPEYALGAPDGRLAGWGPGRGSIILDFLCKNGLGNVEGHDLFIWHFGGKSPKVFVTTDREKPINWHLVGSLSNTGKSHGPAVKEGFDFGKLKGVFHVKIEKTSFGFGTGHFVDAVCGMNGSSIP